ncbi:uncharacterized protein LOC126900512 [Daktulosphaira vitifoliae]|uniref:uncharacterized protein LOC126900512 n=1 Tax=Daktulosphaira vitifoliae TaxID=58002 RepID=UPI0021AADD98|nr:uncharacterized protein LOC126900512 [Daktulosphaira vitifoliae]
MEIRVVFLVVALAVTVSEAGVLSNIRDGIHNRFNSLNNLNPFAQVITTQEPQKSSTPHNQLNGILPTNGRLGDINQHTSDPTKSQNPLQSILPNTTPGPKLETTTHTRSIINAPSVSCPNGQKMTADRECREEFVDD